LTALEQAYAAKTGGDSYLNQLVSPDEVGWVIVVLAAIGIVLLLRAPRSRLVTAGWLAFLIVQTGTQMRYPYQQFRNILPDMPIRCVGAAVTVVAAADYLIRRFAGGRSVLRYGAVGLVAILLALLLFFGGLVPHYQAAFATNTRILAREWLAEHSKKTSRVLVVEELTLMPSELKRVQGTVRVRSMGLPLPDDDLQRYDFIVTGLDPDGKKPFV